MKFEDIKVGQQFTLKAGARQSFAFARIKHALTVKVIGRDTDGDLLITTAGSVYTQYISADTYSDLSLIALPAPEGEPTSKPKRKLTPQVKTILTHLEKVGDISGIEASAMYKVRSLPRRITDLKEAGYDITREFKKDATGQRYVRYYYNQQAA